MLNPIYESAGILMDFLLAMLIAHYVFLIPSPRNRLGQAAYLMISCAFCIGICWFLGTVLALVMLGIVLGVYIYLTGTGNTRRYFRVLQLFPILGTTLGLLMPPIQIPAMLFSLRTEVREIYSLVVCVLSFLAIPVFYYFENGWRREFNEGLQHRQLGQWEKTLLYVVGTLMLIFVPTLSGYADAGLSDESARGMIVRLSCISSLVCFIITLTVIILILQGSRSAHLREQVLQMQHNIIITMADIVENRDENTGGHIRRTAKYVEIIAVSLKMNQIYSSILTDQYIADMIIAAPLHDIGKIHIPDAVLKKQGRFTDEEYQIMKSHTTAGKKLLQRAEKTLGDSSYLDIAVQMAGYHHEWWNGKGYPEGLKGQDIPLCARIMAVADVFDAIVSQRCYKGAMSLDEAFELIPRESGTHFDPAIVEAFLDAKEEITEVLHEFMEEEAVPHEEEALPMAGASVPVRPELEKVPAETEQAAVTCAAEE